jgi:hypothetical protein
LRTRRAQPLSGLQAEEHGALDPRALAACRATPRTRAQDTLAAARAQTGGWHASALALGRLELAPGESLSLFPEPEPGALALPRLPDLDARTRGLIEHELLA